MTRFGFNLVLAVVWCLMWGSFSAWNLMGGMAVGAFVISGYSRVAGMSPYMRKLWHLLRFGIYFATILTKSNIQIAKEVITPGWSQTPRILRYPVGHLTDAQKTTLANAITLTPGTLSVDISPDGAFLYLHCMYAENREKAIGEIDELADRLTRWVFS